MSLTPAFWKSLITGIVVGGICVGGLQGGLRLFLREDGTSGQRKFRRTLGGIFMGGQLFVCMGILFWLKEGPMDPLALGVGLIGSTFLLSTWLRE